MFVCLSGQWLKKNFSHCLFSVVCFIEKGGGSGKLRNFLIWEFRLWQLLPKWQLMDLARERFRFKHPMDGGAPMGESLWWSSVIRWKPMFKHPVDGWCAGGCWITLAHGNHGMKLKFHGWGETAPQGQFTWSIVFFFFFLSLFFFFFFFFFLEPFSYHAFFFSLLSLFSWAFFFLSFFFFLK